MSKEHRRAPKAIGVWTWRFSHGVAPRCGRSFEQLLGPPARRPFYQLFLFFLGSRTKINKKEQMIPTYSNLTLLQDLG